MFQSSVLSRLCITEMVAKVCEAQETRDSKSPSSHSQSKGRLAPSATQRLRGLPVPCCAQQRPTNGIRNPRIRTCECLRAARLYVVSPLGMVGCLCPLPSKGDFYCENTVSVSFLETPPLHPVSTEAFLSILGVQQARGQNRKPSLRVST